MLMIIQNGRGISVVGLCLYLCQSCSSANLNVASEFLIFAWGLSYGLSKFSDDFTPFVRL